MSSFTEIEGKTAQPSRKDIRKSLLASGVGNLLEWYDWTIYAVASIYIASALFDKADPTSALLNTLAVFAVGFISRPIGGFVFGPLANKYGRKKSMVISICLMALSSFLFAALPTYEQVGMAAPFLLLLVRLLQGLSVGGEYGAVATYMSELGLKGQRGFFSSFQYVTLTGGQLLASLLGVIFLGFMTEQQLQEGGWRIPFVIGGLAAIVSLLARSRLEETLSHEESDKEESGTLRELFKNHWKTFLLVVGYTSAGSLSFYVITVYSKTYMTKIGIDATTVGLIMTVCIFILMVAQPFFGILSDKISRRNSMLLFSSLMAIAIYPVMAIGMRTFSDSPVIVALLLIFLMMLLSLYTSISGIVKAEMFPPHVRALGVGFSYAVGNAVFGGSAPSVALQFKSAGIENTFFIYVIVMLVICFLCSLQLPKEAKYLKDDH
ncbi:MFS transporter [Acinetobacter sp. 105-3]|uniref:MFS transporter n=1 Tax=Acinetobacter sp. 105-3 TaxID=2686015 RepID=UPI00195BE9FA|nr:MFS transporter [Acinetobacter sp. 105-3]MBM7141787.1 MFS transporter [Acinetobacter sp. 105-3]